MENSVEEQVNIRKDISVMFLCLENLCRSPMAEAVFAHIVAVNGYSCRFHSIDSSGTGGIHVNKPPDRRSQRVCRRYGITMASLGQQLNVDDFDFYDYIVALDHSVLMDIKQIQPPSSKCLVKLFGDFDDGLDIEDPYYGIEAGFDETFRQCVKYSLGFLRWLGFCAHRYPPVCRPTRRK